jgi:hypothetical protein
MTTTTIQIKGTEFKTPADAIQHASDNEDGFVAIQVGGRYFSLRQAEAHRIEAMRVGFAYLNDQNGVLVTVPVN